MELPRRSDLKRSNAEDRATRQGQRCALTVPDGAVGKAGHDSGRLLAVFVDMPRQHAGLVFGVQFSRRCGDERDRSFTHNALDAPTSWRIRIFNRGLMNNASLADESANEASQRCCPCPPAFPPAADWLQKESITVCASGLVS